jgi:hypothetical protein
MSVVERLAQHEHRTFGRGEPFQQQQHGHRDGFALLRAVQRAQRRVLGEHRFGQPLADVGLPPDPRRGQFVAAHVGEHGGQPGDRIDDAGPVGRVPAQEGVLHRVLGRAGRAEQPVGDGEQARAMGLECLDVGRRRRHRLTIRPVGGGAVDGTGGSG